MEDTSCHTKACPNTSTKNVTRKHDTFFRRKNRLKIVSVFCDIFVTEFVTVFCDTSVRSDGAENVCDERASERWRRRSYGVKRRDGVGDGVSE